MPDPHRCRQLTNLEDSMPQLKGFFTQVKKPGVKVYFVGFKNILEFLIDTGFNGRLCLPNNVAKELELEIEQETPFTGIGHHQGSLQVSTSKIN